MAFPTLLGTNTASVTADTIHPLATIPSGSSGDLILVMACCTGSELSLSLSGYTTLYLDESAGADVTLFIAYKSSTGTDLPLVLSTSNTCDSVSIVRRFSGWASVSIGSSDTATGNSAPVSSHNAGSASDRMWVSSVGIDGNPTVTTPGLSNESSVNTSLVRLESGTTNSSSATVSMGTYLLGSIKDWVTNSVLIDSSAAASNTLTIDATLGNITSNSTLQESMELSIASDLDAIQSIAQVIAFPNTTIQLGEITSAGVLQTYEIGTDYVVQLGEFTSGGSLYTFKPTAAAKVWDGAAWVSAPPKVWNGSSWVDATLRVYHSGEWVEVH